ncbi:MAG: hypothetical protein MRECE_15c023 [Mycoplasmataceae bacterium CE_OT135]|nr:MAG: hypothetical protein MRECE_15c023 [Mycoplasmataceae bacterium CE_OT135]
MYMSGKSKQYENKPIKKRDFDKMVKAMLKVPPPKNWKDTKRD